MNYKEKYNKHVEAVKELQEANPSDEGLRNWVNDNVPELQWSEDEKIRKELIFYLGDMPEDTELRNGITNRDVLAWLEKQGEQKPTETVKWGQQEESCICQLESLVKEQWRQAEKVHNSVNIKKMSGLMFFLKTLNPNKKPQGKTALEAINEEKVDNANKVENETEIPYGAKDSELIEESYYIPKGFHAEIDEDKVVIKKGEKPTAWSVDDDAYKVFAISAVKYYYDGDNPLQKHLVDWLKSIKGRVGCEANCTTTKKWKPSDEQMDALEYGKIELNTI